MCKAFCMLSFWKTKECLHLFIMRAFWENRTPGIFFPESPSLWQYSCPFLSSMRTVLYSLVGSCHFCFLIWLLLIAFWFLILKYHERKGPPFSSVYDVRQTTMTWLYSQDELNGWCHCLHIVLSLMELVLKIFCVFFFFFHPMRTL